MRKDLPLKVFLGRIIRDYEEDHTSPNSCVFLFRALSCDSWGINCSRDYLAPDHGRLYRPLRRRRYWDVEHASVLAVVQDSDMRGARVFGGLIRDHSAGVVILLKVDGVGRADHQS